MNEQEKLLGTNPELIKTYERNWNKLESIDQDSFQGLVQLNKIATEIFFEDEAFLEWQTILSDDEEAVKKTRDAIEFHNFPSEGTTDKALYSKLLEASHIKEQLGRAYINRLVEGGTSFGLDHWELDVLVTSCLLAGEYDALCGRWREDVPHNPLNQKAEELGLTNQYAIILDREDGPEEVSYAEAYEEQVGKITQGWMNLAQRLKDGSKVTSEQEAMANYLVAYADALGSRDLKQLPELWREVDRVWLSARGRVQPVASREYDYYDPNAIRVFPDFRLVIINEESELMEPVEATRQAMINHLEDEFGQLDVFNETKNGMSQIQVFPEGYDVVFAGSLDFQPAGQFLPNEYEVKRLHGVKDFLNLEVTRDRWGLAMDLVRNVFPKDVDLFEQVDVERDGVAIQLAGHEIGEPLFDTDEVRESMGADVFRLLNEDAATLSITAILPKRVKNRELTEEFLVTHTLKLLGIYLRYIDFARGAEKFDPYYKGMGLLGLKRMVDSGFISFQDGEVRPNIENTDGLYELSMRDLREQAEIAETGDKKRALKYLKPIEDAEDIPEIKYLIEAIHGSL